MPRSNLKRLKKTTFRQYEIMLDFLQNHPEMISGKLTDSFTSQRREELWRELTIALNAVDHGPQKTLLKWRKTWIDIKSETKSKLAEAKKQSQLRGYLHPPPLPVHLDRIRSLLGLSYVVSDQNAAENNQVDQCFIKECFTEEILPDASELQNGNSAFDKDLKSTIKIENVTDILSASEQSDNFSTIFTPAEPSCENMSNIFITTSEPSCENMSNIFITTAEAPCEKISDNISRIPCEKVSDTPTTSTKSSENNFDTIKPSEKPYERVSSNLSTSPKTPCEKVCHDLSTSVKKLNDVIRSSENRTILAFNALTKATVRANEIHERQLQIEEERNKLYRERNDILFTLVNTFREKKLNHQH